MIDIVLCASGADEVRIVHGISREHAGRARVVRRCADLAEALGAVTAGIGDVVVIDLAVRGLDRDALADMMSRGAAVVGLTHEDSAGGAGTTLGLRCTLDARSSVDAVMEQVAAALAGGEEIEAWTQDVADAPEPTARALAVWGPAGAPGRSTVAANLAFEAASEGTPTVLVDADTYGPSLAQLFGVIDDSPGLVAACRAAARDTLDASTLETLIPQVAGDLRLLSGIGVPARWGEIREGSLDRVFSALGQRDGLVVIDTGFCLEADEDLDLDSLAPHRNAAAITALTRADAVLAVVGADPVSVTRLLRERERLDELGIASLHVVVNRIASPGEGERWRALIAERFPAASITALPEDVAACRRALGDGAALAESARRSPLRRALRELALRLAAPEGSPFSVGG